MRKGEDRSDPGRDQSVRIFCDSNVKTDEAANAKIFVEFVALIVRSRCMSC